MTDAALYFCATKIDRVLSIVYGKKHSERLYEIISEQRNLNLDITSTRAPKKKWNKGRKTQTTS